MLILRRRSSNGKIRLRGATHEPQTGVAINQRTEIVWEKSDFSAGLRALESSIRVAACPKGVKYDRLMRARALMRAHTVPVFFFAGLVGLTLGWNSHREEAQEVVRRWASSVDRLLSGLRGNRRLHPPLVLCGGVRQLHPKSPSRGTARTSSVRSSGASRTSDRKRR